MFIKETYGWTGKVRLIKRDMRTNKVITNRVIFNRIMNNGFITIIFGFIYKTLNIL